MTEKDIKPIPNYIMKEIHKRDMKIYPWQENIVRFYAYLTVWKKELIKVTVAVSTIKGKQWACKQVAVHGIHSPKCYVRDMEYNYLGHGFNVGWYAEELQSQQKRFEDGKWYPADTRYYDLYQGRDIIKYLRIYEQYPQTEYLLKLGLGAYAENRSLLKKIAKDKAFRKWVALHRKELALPWGNSYNFTTITQAYKTGLPLKDVSHFLFRKKQFERQPGMSPIRELFQGWELKAYFDYTEKQNISDRLYLDYLNACNKLGIDMSLKQNRLPKDFTYWHDLRIDQYAEQKAIEEANKKQELMQKFSEVAEKYLPLQHNKRSAFICVIAKSPADLIREGEFLHHCVGRMNYDQRMVREESLIFFVRAKDSPDIPLVTLEYSPRSHKVLQCYGEHDHKPSEDILHYVNKIWLPYANRTIKQIAA